MKRDAIQEILDYNEPKYNYIKLAEELAELQEVVIKRYLKKEAFKPPMTKIIEEAGDVLLRLKVLARMENISIPITDRVKEKSDKLLGYIDAGKYKGGV